MKFFKNKFNEMSTLHLACLSGNSNTVNAILNFVNGKDFESEFLSSKSGIGMNAFHYACMNWTSDVLLTLLQSGRYENFKENENSEDWMNTRKKFYKDDVNENSDDKVKPLHVAITTGYIKNVDLIMNYRQQALQTEQQHLNQIMQIEQAQNAQKVQQNQSQNQLSKSSRDDQNLQNLTLFIQKVYPKKAKKILLNLPQPKHPQNQTLQQQEDQVQQQQQSKEFQILEQKRIEREADFLNKQILLRRRNRELLTYSHIINSATQKMNKTPLIMAVQYGDTELVSLLVKQKHININLRDIIGRSALHHASFYGFSEIVKILLHKKGVFLNEQSSEGMTPLHYGCMKDHPEIVSLLLKFRNIENNEQVEDTTSKFVVDVNAKTPWTLEAPIHFVKSASVLNIMIDEGQNLKLNAVDRNGLTILHIACKTMNREVANVLIKKAISDSSSININAQDKYGKTPLYYACLNSDLEIVKTLLQVNAIKINIADNDGISPIRAACFNPDPNLIDLLLSRNDLILEDRDKEIVDRAKEIKV